jgi:hypothetical protein
MTTSESCDQARSSHEQFDAARRSAGWTIEQLWIHYLALGGTLVVFDLEAFLAGLVPMPGPQQDVLACALNERLADLGQPRRVPYLSVVASWPGERSLARLLQQPPPPDRDQL